MNQSCQEQSHRPVCSGDLNDLHAAGEVRLAAHLAQFLTRPVLRHDIPSEFHLAASAISFLAILQDLGLVW